MNLNEPVRTLNDLLGFKDRPAESAAESPLERSERSEPASPTALQLDQWSLRRGLEAMSRLPALQKHLGYEPESDEGPNAGDAINAAADFLGAAYEPRPELAPACENRLRQSFMETLLESPEYRALHSNTQLDELASEIAACQFAEKFGTVRDEAERPGNQPKPGDGSIEGDLKLIRAVGEAVEQAKQEVNDLDDAAAACGHGPGSPGTRRDPKAIAEIFKRVRNDRRLRRICELAGRYRRLAQSKQRQKVQHGYDDLVGVQMDGDVGRLLPVELATLADPDLELDTLRRLVERQTFCREYRGVEPVGKGPIVVVVDESGSMASRERIHNAKALALALAWVARHQRRWCGLVGFAGGTTGHWTCLPPGKWNDEQLLDWLTHFYGGGTDMDVPLVELPNRYWPDMVAAGMRRGKTDIICITDAVVQVPPEMERSFLAWKKAESVRMVSLVLGHDARDLARVSDEVHCLSDLDVGGEAVQRVVSL